MHAQKSRLQGCLFKQYHSYWHPILALCIMKILIHGVHYRAVIGLFIRIEPI